MRWLTFFRLTFALRPDGFGRWFALGALMAALHAAAQLTIPLIIGALVDDALLARDLGMLRVLALSLVAVAAVNILCRSVYLIAFALLGERALVERGRELIDKLHRLPFGFFDRERSGEVHSLFNQDLPSTSRLGYQVIGDGMLGVLKLAGLVAILPTKYGWLSLAALLLIPVYVVVPALVSGRTRAAAQAFMRARAGLNARSQEAFQGIREIKLFGRGTWNSIHLLRRLRDQQRRFVFFTILRNATTLNALVYFMVTGLVYWLGGRQVIAGELSVGDLVALAALLNFLEGPINKIVSLNADIQTALAADERLRPVLEREEERDTGSIELSGDPSRAGVRFRAVTFRYEGSTEPALHDLSFDVRPGEQVAIVGPSGAGKSTLVSLLPRLYDPQHGSVEIGGVDVRDCTLGSLREHVGAVFQDTFLFPGTVRENIRFGRLEASDREIEAAAVAANAHEFIERLPDRYETEIGERGAMLSGGQRQRLAIARVFLRNPGILILDEATSALDKASEEIVQQAIRRIVADRTTFVVAHRLSTIETADRVLLLVKGRLEGQGTHQDLLVTNSKYRSLWEDETMTMEGAPR